MIKRDMILNISIQVSALIAFEWKALTVWMLKGIYMYMYMY